MKLFSFLRLRKQVPVGFVDYDVDTIARRFDIDAQVAKSVVREYHDLLDGVDSVGSNIVQTDLFALSKAISSKFGTAPATSASIARWFGRLKGVREEQHRAQNLGITEKTWMAACQHGSLDGNQLHIAYEGRKFLSDRGLLVDGAYLLPGAEIGCKCSGRAVVKGFEH